MQWNQKESALLRDLKGQEQLCVDKYTRYAAEAHDPQLKNLFTRLAQEEQQHLQTIRQMEQGTMPQGGGGGKSAPAFTASYTTECRELQPALLQQIALMLKSFATVSIFIRQ